jgi:hypothetical protein
MSEEQEVNVEAQAKELGWKPKEEFTGNPDNWVPADEYMKRGETILPYMQADRKRLFKKVEEQGQQISALRSQLAESAESITVLKQFATTDALKQKDAEIAQLRRQLAEVRRNGTPEQEVELESQLDEARDERAELAAKAKPGNAQGNAQGNGQGTPANRVGDLARSPEFMQFLRDNPWYDVNSPQFDAAAHGAATAISAEIGSNPETRGLSFAEKLALTAERTRTRLGIGAPQSRGRSKVEGSAGAGAEGGGGGRKGGGPSYDSLPPEAKAICDRQEKLFVGPGKRYKTQAEWRKAYAEKVSA